MKFLTRIWATFSIYYQSNFQSNNHIHLQNNIHPNIFDVHHPNMENCNKLEKNAEISVSFSKTEERSDLQPFCKTRRNQVEKQF